MSELILGIEDVKGLLIKGGCNERNEKYSRLVRYGRGTINN